MEHGQPNKQFSWLHFSDIHVGMPEIPALWPNIQRLIENDLTSLHKQTGPWDAIFFTGDLVNTGARSEFRKFTQIFTQIRTRLRELGSDPVLLAVPGNHDLTRPNSDGAAATALWHLWRRHGRIRDLFWTCQDSDYWKVMAEAFSNWTDWAKTTIDKNRVAKYREGLLPGDFAATIDCNSIVIGILGLNTAALQLRSGEYKTKLSLHPRQLESLFDDGIHSWINRHHACFLLTHHPADWLDIEGQQTLLGEINIPGNFVLHLCGHRHESSTFLNIEGGAKPRITSVGHSLFGLETWGERKKVDRIHGYSVGTLAVQDTRQLRIWPRKGQKQQGGHIQIVPDYSVRLQADGGMASYDLGPAPSTVIPPLHFRPFIPKMDPKDVECFLGLIRNSDLRRETKAHLDAVSQLGFETADNEDDFISLRRHFYNRISQYHRQFLHDERAFSKISERKPASHLIPYEVGRVFTENRQGEAAFDLLSPLKEDFERYSGLYSPEYKARILDGIGEAARFADQYTEAKRLYNEALAIDPNNYFALKHLGTIYRIEGDLPKALECFEKALDIKRIYHVLFSIGYLHHDFNHYEQALPYYEECIEQLDELGKSDYYRVYLKLACLYLIRSDEGNAERFLHKALQSAEAYQPSDEFVKVTIFAVRLFQTLISERRQALARLGDCERYVRRKVDVLTHSVFYCVFTDIMRVIKENPSLLWKASEQLGSDNANNANRLKNILNMLRMKHLLFQCSGIQSEMYSIAPVGDWLDVLVSPNTGANLGNDKLKEALCSFESFPWRPSSSQKNVLQFNKAIINHEGNAIYTVMSSFKKHFDYLLDHGSIALSLRSEKNNLYPYAELLRPFTALVPEKLRQPCFPDYFYVQDDDHFSGFVRLLSKKLMCLDPTTNRRIFINPTIGCSIQCSYCYLPEYGIATNHEVTPSELEGMEYRSALEQFSGFIKGKTGTLVSIGSFCDPFLPQVQQLTISILEAIIPLGNPIQISTKSFPEKALLEKITSILPEKSDQIMINLSLNDISHRTARNIHQWLRYSDKIPMTIYIKPFLKSTSNQIEDFIEIGLNYSNLSFVVGSLYLGDLIQSKISGDGDFDYISFEQREYLVSPVVPEPSVIGFTAKQEDEFRQLLASRLEKPVFKTSSCPLSVRYGIRDPLRNFKRPFCIQEACPNFYSHCNNLVKENMSEPSGNELLYEG